MIYAKELAMICSVLLVYSTSFIYWCMPIGIQYLHLPEPVKAR